MRYLTLTVCLFAATLPIGCDRSRQQAHDRVVGALNAKGVSVSSNSCAVLRLPTGYAAIVFSSFGQTSTFRVFFSQSGRFSSDQRSITEGSFRESKISVEGAPIYIAYDGENASAVMLDWEDTHTGI